MELIKTIEDLVRFRTETGNNIEIDKCLAYIADSFAGTAACVRIERFDDASPVIYISNNSEMKQDALVLGHIDVVKAADDMFEPRVAEGKMYGRGTLDMKSFAVVAMNSMHYVLEHKLPVKFGIILSTDEEKGSKSTHAFLKKYPDLTANVVLDNDVGGDIAKIINKCKNPVFVKLIAEGRQAHGSTPWEGLDANEMLMRTIANLREKYPYFDMNSGAPEDTWVDTMHVALINGGEVSNIIAGLKKRKKDIESLIKTKTNQNYRIIQGIYKTAYHYLKELNVEKFADQDESYLFTSDLKSLSGAVLHLTVFAFKLAYIKAIEEKIQVSLPIVIDSPSGKEVVKENVDRMLQILKRDFTNNQVIIASIYSYDIEGISVHPIEKSLMGEEFL